MMHILNFGLRRNTLAPSSRQSSQGSPNDQTFHPASPPLLSPPWQKGPEGLPVRWERQRSTVHLPSSSPPVSPWHAGGTLALLSRSSGLSAETACRVG